MKMITENIVSLIIKVSLISSSFVLARFQVLSEMDVVNRAFEMSFSVGLMVVFLIYMIYENRKKDMRQVEVFGTYVDMTKETTKTIENFTQILSGINQKMESDKAKHTRENADIASLLSDVNDRIKYIERVIKPPKND